MRTVVASAAVLALLLISASEGVLAQTASDPVGLANPASVICAQCGGSVLVVPTPQGETGWCLFPGGVVFEEWSFWRLFNPQTVQAP
ncbi:MAG: DUF333 domain-containing protein [Thermodesulfobacteriota bacterium]